jgi:hypothetical protein
MTYGIIALVIIFACAGLILLFGLVPGLRDTSFLRDIPAFDRLRKAMGAAVEAGTRLHVSLGKSSLIQPTNTSALVGLTVLEQISLYSGNSDRPPVATSGDGALALLSQDTERAAFRISGAPENFNPDRGVMTGPTPFSYIAGALPLVDTENISAHVLLGNFGPEVALLTESGERQSAYTLAGSDSLPAQAALYASAQEALIGEELYAVPAYLDRGPLHKASLQVQDILRWTVIITLGTGALLKLLGVL